MIYVSITTTKERLHLCRFAVRSLLDQATLPDKIFIWVSKESYLNDSGVKQKSELKKLLSGLGKFSEIVEVKFTKNIGPYRKLFPMLRFANEDDIIVTADDDICYGENWLKYLIQEHRKQDSKTVVAARVRNINYNFLGFKKSYSYWDIITGDELLPENYLITFGAGVVLKKNFFKDDQIRNESFLKFAPTADDIWYTKLLDANNLNVKVSSSALKELFFIKHKTGLHKINMPQHTMYWSRIRRRIWDKPMGYLGLSISTNDRVYKSVQDIET